MPMVQIFEVISKVNIDKFCISKQAVEFIGRKASHFYLALTPQSRVLLQKNTVAQPVTKVLTFMEPKFSEMKHADRM
jgi:hypothetical protein